MEKSVKQTVWKEAATGGLFLGVILAFVQFLSYWMRSAQGMTWLPGLLNFIAIVALIYLYGKKVSALYGAEGFSYGQSMGFVIRMMLFAGVLSGVAQYVLQNFVAPEYYAEQVELALLNAGFSETMTDEMMNNMGMLKNPFLMIFSGMLSMLIYGGLVGLIVSVFIKRPADPFGGDPAGENGGSEPCNTSVHDSF